MKPILKKALKLSTYTRVTVLERLTLIRSISPGFSHEASWQQCEFRLSGFPESRGFYFPSSLPCSASELRWQKAGALRVWSQTVRTPGIHLVSSRQHLQKVVSLRRPLMWALTLCNLGPLPDHGALCPAGPCSHIYDIPPWWMAPSDYVPKQGLLSWLHLSGIVLFTEGVSNCAAIRPNPEHSKGLRNNMPALKTY